jgi:Icc-related predicted phosphoesterase
MRLLAITDLHGDAARLEAILVAAAPVDMILLGGDLTDFGTPEDAAQLVRRAQAAGPPVWAVAGNCDSPEIEHDLAVMGISLHGRGIVHDGVGLCGLGAMPPWGKHMNMYHLPEEELAERLEAGYASIHAAARQVVLSHAPPHGLRDRTHLLQHAGSLALRRFIERRHPALVLCGHIHEARGIDHLGPTVVVNSAPARAGFYAVVEIGQQGRIQVEIEQVRGAEIRV